MNDPLIQVNGLNFSYVNGDRVFDNFSLELHDGERLGVTGANGSGKTTLLRLLLGLERAGNGSVTVLGRTHARNKDTLAIRGEVGLLFQHSDDQLFCPTVFEDVAFGPLNQGCLPKRAHDIAHETLDALGLTDIRRRITYQLSYGQKRLVALATILAMKPKILLLDEPTTGLDEKHEARLTEILLGLPQEMIIVSHNQPFLDRVATRTVGIS